MYDTIVDDDLEGGLSLDRFVSNSFNIMNGIILKNHFEIQ